MKKKKKVYFVGVVGTSDIPVDHNLVHIGIFQLYYRLQRWDQSRYSTDLSIRTYCAIH